MNQQILFSDFDGTLYDGISVGEANRDAVARWREAGNLFCLATGRQLSILKEHLEREDVGYDGLICLNGAEGYDREGHLLFEHSLNGAILPDLFDCMLQGVGWAYVCLGDRRDSILAPEKSAKMPHKPWYNPDRLYTFERFTQICTQFETVEASTAARDRLRARFGDVISAEINGTSLDVNAAGVCKSEGIASMLNAMNLHPADVCAVGDNFNDLCMIHAYHGCAMNRSPEAVRLQAGRTVESVAELINFLLKK